MHTKIWKISLLIGFILVAIVSVVGLFANKRMEKQQVIKDLLASYGIPIWISGAKGYNCEFNRRKRFVAISYDVIGVSPDQLINFYHTESQKKGWDILPSKRRYTPKGQFRFERRSGKLREYIVGIDDFFWKEDGLVFVAIMAKGVDERPSVCEEAPQS